MSNPPRWRRDGLQIGRSPNSQFHPVPPREKTVRNQYLNHPQTAIRHRLLANGYTPIASAGKAGMPKKWQDIVVNEAQILRWDRDRSFTAMAGERATTSVRIDGDLFVIDIDVRHEAAAEAVEAVLWDTAPEFMELCLRRGSGSRKVALFGRIDGVKIRARHTASFINPEHPDEGERVEFFGAGTARHFVVAGPYVLKDGSIAPGREYSFDAGGSMADVPLAELPVFPADKLAEVIDACEAALGRHMERVPNTSKGVEEQAQLYDLEPDHEWRLADGRLIRLADAEIAAQAAAATGEELRGYANLWDRGSKTPNRVKAVIGFTGLVLIDFKTGASHRWASRRPVDFKSDAIVGGLQKLREQQQAFNEQEQARRREQAEYVQEEPALGWATEPPALPRDATFEEAVANCLIRYGARQHDGWPVDLYATSTEKAAFKPEGMKAMFKKYSRYLEGPRGGTVEENVVAFWYANPERLTITDVRMRPDRAFPIFVDDDGGIVKNTYRRPRHVGEGELGAFSAFIAHLIPDQRERDYFMRWLAFKHRYPQVPGVSIIFVAYDDVEGKPIYGTGRGTLFKIIEKLFGERYVSHQSFDVLTGVSSQSVYDDWLAGSVVVTVDEARIDPNGARFGNRQATYERLKEIVDPSVRTRTLQIKGGQRFAAQVFASLLIATNHPDAIMIPQDDRRFSIIANGVALPFDHPVHDWMTVPGNIAALARHLDAIELGSFRSDQPLDTDAKRHMASMSDNDLDHAIAEARKAFSSLFTKAQLRTFVGRELDALGRGDFDKQFDAAFRRRCSPLSVRGNRYKVITATGRREYVWHFGRKPMARLDLDNPGMIRAEVLANDKLAASGLSALREAANDEGSA